MSAAVLLLLALFAQEPKATITLRDAYPVRGVSTGITVTGLVPRRLTITYQPGAPIATITEVAVSPRQETIAWTPERAGIVRIEAFAADGTSVAKNVSVTFDGVPGGGVLIALVAGMLLFGGAGFSLRGLLNQE